MAISGKKISDLPVPPSPIQVTDIFPFVQPAVAGTTYQVTFQELINLITSNVPIFGDNYINVTSSSQSMDSNKGYTADSPSLISFTLPSVCRYGSILEIIGINSGLWEILQNSGQSIQVGNTTTTVGVTGKLESTLPSDGIQLRCVVENLKFAVIGSQTMGFNVI